MASKESSSLELKEISINYASEYFKEIIQSNSRELSSKEHLLFILTVKEKDFEWNLVKSYDEMIKCYNKHRSKLKTGTKLPKTKELKNLSNSEKRETMNNIYLMLLNNDAVVNTNYFKEFLEISSTSFQGTLKKGKEGYIKKQTGGRVGNDSKCFNCSRHFKRFQKRWLIVRDSGIYLSKSIENDEMSEYLMFDNEFNLKYGPDTGYNLGILISNSKRKLLIKTSSMLKQLDWIKALKEAEQVSKCHEFRPYNSLYISHPGNNVKIFIDGENYFRKVYQKLKSAKSQVLISDWWLSPELHLKRPAHKNEKSMLITVLKNIAQKPGLSIYIHVYKEVSSALTLNSKYTVNQLRAAHPNIRAIRHPKRSIYGGEFLWSHHEKLICIDQEIAFLGGLDLCYGRWDNHKHSLKDKKDSKKGIFNGIDYSNSRIKDFLNVEDWKRDQLDRKTQPRMPWHDAALMIKGKAAYDVSVNFIELWNHVMTDFYGWYNSNKKNLLTPFLTAKVNKLIESDRSFVDSSFSSKMNESVELSFNDESIKRKREQTMSERGSITPSLSEEMKIQEKRILPTIRKEIKKINIQGSCHCQIVRSAGLWSYGLSERDRSIQNAYIQLIREAQRFIYIENQFFISNTAGDPVENEIAQALVDKIKEMHSNNKRFKVIVVLPLLPGFAGEADSCALLRIQMHWQFQTISRSESSIHSQLIKAGIDPGDFIRFYGLRNHALLNNVPVTEIVYVHSKYMIVDDNKLIIGSANINDRSMLGNHDSEIAVVIEDSEKVEVFINGIKTKASKLVHNMRIKVFKEFSGEEDTKKLEDPFSDQFYKEWEGNAENNTLKYRDVFGCYPDDTILRNSDVEMLKVKTPSLKKYDREKDQIKGFLVNFPLNFLKDEDLTFKLTDMERLIPMKSFI